MQLKNLIRANSKYITTFLTGVLVFATVIAFPPNTQKTVATEEVNADTNLEQNFFKDLSLEAKAAYVFDIKNNKVLYEKNANVVLPLASLTKLMTAITAADIAPRQTIVTIDPEALKEYGSDGLKETEKWLLPNLLKYMLVVSSNDGAAAVASAFGSRIDFIMNMNAKARILGLSDMQFNNESGLDVDKTTAGGYGSAKSIGTLFTYAINRYRDILEPTRYPSFEVASENKTKYTARNTDIIANTIPGIIAGKTGYSDLAGGNLAVVFDANLQHPIVVVVLGSSFEGRFVDVEKLVEATLSSL